VELGTKPEILISDFLILFECLAVKNVLRSYVQKESQTNQPSLQKTKFISVIFVTMSKNGTVFQKRIFVFDRSGGSSR